MKNCSISSNNKHRCLNCHDEPTSTAPTSTPAHSTLNILQFNCNGFLNKIDEILHHLTLNNIHIAAFQETKLSHRSKEPKLPNYVLHCLDHPSGNGGGLLLLIHNSIHFSIINLPRSPTIEQQAISIKSNNTTITIINIYIPPTSSCPTNFKATINHLLNIPNSYILGDFNAHNPLWYSSLHDQRGEDLSNEIDLSEHGTLNTDTPTRLPSNGQPTSPDISIASNNLLLNSEWTTSITLSSDHLPIQICLHTNFLTSDTPHRTFTNFSKANWTQFTAETEHFFRLTVFPHNIAKAEKRFRHILISAGSHCIPSGRFTSTKPGLSNEIVTLINQRDQIRAANHTSDHITSINNRIHKLSCQLKNTRWKDFLDTFDRHTNVKRLWATIKSLNGKPSSHPNKSISINGKPIFNNYTLAKKFNKLFTSTSKHSTNKLNRIINS